MGEGAGKRGRVLLKRALPKKKKRLCMSGRRLSPADAGGPIGLKCCRSARASHSERATNGGLICVLQHGSFFLVGGFLTVRAVIFGKEAADLWTLSKITQYFCHYRLVTTFWNFFFSMLGGIICLCFGAYILFLVI